jgi:putative acetyltransferase
MLTIEEAYSADQVLQVRSLFEEYAAALGIDLSFQGFEEELRTLPGGYARPQGRLLLARWNDEAAGCIGVRNIGTGVCEMKRLYVRPAFRALGVGRALVLRSISEAREAGYLAMRLDSLPFMGRALTLYRELGFHEIAPYRDNPIDGAVFLELQLRDQPG